MADGEAATVRAELVAVEIEVAAKKRAEDIVAEARVAIKAAEEQKKNAQQAVGSMFATAKVELEGTQAKRDALLTECTELEKRLAKAQAAVNKLLA